MLCNQHHVHSQITTTSRCTRTLDNILRGVTATVIFLLRHETPPASTRFQKNTWWLYPPCDTLSMLLETWHEGHGESITSQPCSNHGAPHPVNPPLHNMCMHPPFQPWIPNWRTAALLNPPPKNLNLPLHPGASSSTCSATAAATLCVQTPS